MISKQLYIERVILKNFKRFSSFDVNLKPGTNIFVGDNEAGKSTLLNAIDLVLTGNRRQVEAAGLENLFNRQAISSFLNGDRKVNELPELYVELYLADFGIPELQGKNNSLKRNCDGLRLRCVPNDEYQKILTDILNGDEKIFPFEYYKIDFQTFQGDAYTNYKRYVNHILIDHSGLSAESASRGHVRDLYQYRIDAKDNAKHHYAYRTNRAAYSASSLQSITSGDEDFKFQLRTTNSQDFERDLTISFNGIPIENRGKGHQSIIKTQFALQKKQKTSRELHLLMLEEPENHLSHSSLAGLVSSLQAESNRQMIIATHNSLVASRLDLRNIIMLSTTSAEPASLTNLGETTARFFIKAPDHNLLELVLSKKVILVEGDAEYMLVDKMYGDLYSRSTKDDGIHIISVDGTSFKRYMEVAKLLKTKVAVITDNDRSYQANCVNRYEDHISEHLAVFSSKNDEQYTFEVCVYQANPTLCDSLFGSRVRTNTILDFMLNNKTEVALQLMANENKVAPPEYIKDAFEWISK